MCKNCLYSGQDKLLVDIKDETLKEKFRADVLTIIDENSEHSAPYIASLIEKRYKEYFPDIDFYGPVKKEFNDLVLNIEDDLKGKIVNSADPILSALKYSVSGNYIDYANDYTVDKNALLKLLDKVNDTSVDNETFKRFKSELETSKKLVYLTDNCGEVVLDKIFIEVLKDKYKNLDITVILRSEDAANDATLTDAKEIGLDRVTRCIGNGSNIPSTIMSKLSEGAREVILEADMIIAKGQGNFEGLYLDSDIRPYYLFLCKCQRFINLFKKERFSIIFGKQEDLEIYGE